MIIRCVPGLSIADLAMARSGEDRTPGLHLSDVLKSIMRKMDPDTYAKYDGKPMDPNTIEPGFAFEVALERAFDARRMNILRIGEVEKDGIIMSPDGLDADDPATLEEFKFTKKSAGGTPTPCSIHSDIKQGCGFCRHDFHVKFLSWVLQIKSYVYALGINHARLRAMFVNGDYSSRQFSDPQFRTWEFEFTDAELHEHWHNLILREVENEGLRAKYEAHK